MFPKHDSGYLHSQPSMFLFFFFSPDRPPPVAEQERLLEKIADLRRVWEPFADQVLEYAHQLRKRRFDEDYDLTSFGVLRKIRDEVKVKLIALETQYPELRNVPEVRSAHRVVSLSMGVGETAYGEILGLRGSRAIFSFEEEQELFQALCSDVEDLIPFLDAQIQVLQETIDETRQKHDASSTYQLFPLKESRSRETGAPTIQGASPAPPATPVTVEPTPVLPVPERVTARWLFDHVSLQLWGLAATALVTAFVIGVAVGQTTFVKELVTYLR